MRLDSLKHIARSVQTMMEAERVIVFGSASLLASFPELGEMSRWQRKGQTATGLFVA